MEPVSRGRFRRTAVGAKKTAPVGGAAEGRRGLSLSGGATAPAQVGLDGGGTLAAEEVVVILDAGRRRGGDDPLAGISLGQGLKGAETLAVVVPGGEQGRHAVGDGQHAEMFGGDGGEDAGAGGEADGQAVLDAFGGDGDGGAPVADGEGVSGQGSQAETRGPVGMLPSVRRQENAMESPSLAGGIDDARQDGRCPLAGFGVDGVVEEPQTVEGGAIVRAADLWRRDSAARSTRRGVAPCAKASGRRPRGRALAGDGRRFRAAGIGGDRDRDRYRGRV